MEYGTEEGDLGGVGLSVWSVLLLVGLNYLFLRNVIAESIKEVTGHCVSPECARCNRDEKFLLRVEYLCRSLSCAYDLLGRNYPQIWELLQSVDRKKEYVRTMWQRSGYESLELEELEEGRCLSTIWILPGLESRPIWTRNDHLDQLFAYFLDHMREFVSAVYLEYRRVQNASELWQYNQTPSGTWMVFYLYNQGTRIDKHCSICPQTAKIVEQTPGFMGDECVFSYAMLSRLLPGSCIEPHTGPCNFRLRCHIPILSSPDYNFRVGSVILNWNIGDIVVFDDSFVHMVWHDKKATDDTGSDKENERVLLILDIWHPQLDMYNKRCLKHLFHSH